ncbi:MAG TPA: DUF2283 domain-containing protein [Candidatus Diapherotrites archaeon]|uniref:DUF2283 domain-containing protein n=1 Tax=Candidatus Iainarchaeum sp. TaxID=3101447 RepID=A0A7J4IVG3_9ARCH|nr:DUF2283 domain-containing protein [Candidatus Diapherotrites archaeon]
MASRFKADYDPDEDILYLYSEKNKSKGSIEFGEIVIDFTAKGDIVGLEIFDASHYLSEITNHRLTKNSLLKASTANLSFLKKRGTTIIKMVIPLEEELAATIAIQNLNYRSPLSA